MSGILFFIFASCELLKAYHIRRNETKRNTLILAPYRNEWLYIKLTIWKYNHADDETHR